MHELILSGVDWTIGSNSHSSKEMKNLWKNIIPTLVNKFNENWNKWYWYKCWTWYFKIYQELFKRFFVVGIDNRITAHSYMVDKFTLMAKVKN